MGRSALGWLNLFVPKDGDTRRVGCGIAFGPHERHRLDLYAPLQQSADLPVLFFIYGGGWDSGTRSDYEFAGRAFAAAGFLTAIADYRVVPEVHYPGFLEDNALALDWLIRAVPSYGGNASRVFYMGHSAGAYNAVMLGLEGQRFGAPDMTDRLKGVVGLSGPYDFYPFDVPASIAAFSRAKEPEATQPVNLVSADAPPMFLGHGTRDRICGLYNTKNLAETLRTAGRPVIERHYRGLKHAAPLLSLMPIFRWRAPVYRETVDFMRGLL